VNSRLPLALLTRSNDLERGVASLLLTLLGGSSAGSGALLGNLGPATTVLLLSEGARGDGVDNALVSKLAAANEFVCEATAVESLGVGVDRVGDDLSLGGEEEKLLNKVIHVDVAVQALAQGQLGPLGELLNSPVRVGLRDATDGCASSNDRTGLGGGGSNGDSSAGRTRAERSDGRSLSLTTGTDSSPSTRSSSSNGRRSDRGRGLAGKVGVTLSSRSRRARSGRLSGSGGSRGQALLTSLLFLLNLGESLLGRGVGLDRLALGVPRRTSGGRSSGGSRAGPVGRRGKAGNNLGLRLAETLLLSKKLGTTSGRGNFFALGSSASLGLLNLLQRRTLGHLVGILSPWSNGGGGSVNGSLGLGARASSQRLGHILAVALGSGGRQRGGGGGRGEGLRHSMINLGPGRFGDRLMLLL
jgi:hypothetical protein